MMVFLTRDNVAFIISNPRATTTLKWECNRTHRAWWTTALLFISNAASKTVLQLAAQGRRRTWISRNKPPTRVLSEGWVLFRGRCDCPSQIMGDFCPPVGDIGVWVAWVFAENLLAPTVYDSVNEHNLDPGGSRSANSHPYLAPGFTSDSLVYSSSFRRLCFQQVSHPCSFTASLSFF